MTGYAAIFEGEGGSWSAYVPELPGCVAAGRSRAEVDRLIREAIQIHIEVMREHGEEVPPPTTVATTIVAPSAS